MASIVGSLKVLLGLDAAEFTTGLTKAEAVTAKFTASQKRNSASIDRQVAALQKQALYAGKSASQIKLLELASKGATAAQLQAADAALVQAESMRASQAAAARFGTVFGVAVAAAAGGIVAVARRAIDAADHLNDLSKKTGIAATTLGGIGFAAEQAGGDLDSAAEALGKLNKTVAAAAVGNKDAAEFLTVLGIEVKNSVGQIRGVDTILAEVADRFAQFEDGPEKA